jgi:hypothetical protein
MLQLKTFNKYSMTVLFTVILSTFIISNSTNAGVHSCTVFNEDGDQLAPEILEYGSSLFISERKNQITLLTCGKKITLKGLKSSNLKVSNSKQIDPGSCYLTSNKVHQTRLIKCSYQTPKDPNYCRIETGEQIIIPTFLEKESSQILNYGTEKKNLLKCTSSPHSHGFNTTNLKDGDCFAFFKNPSDIDLYQCHFSPKAKSKTSTTGSFER